MMNKFLVEHYTITQNKFSVKIPKSKGAINVNVKDLFKQHQAMPCKCFKVQEKFVAGTYDVLYQIYKPQTFQIPYKSSIAQSGVNESCPLGRGAANQTLISFKNPDGVQDIAMFRNPKNFFWNGNRVPLKESNGCISFIPISFYLFSLNFSPKSPQHFSFMYF